MNVWGFLTASSNGTGLNDAYFAVIPPPPRSIALPTPQGSFSRTNLSGVLTNVSDILRLRRDEASESIPVRLAEHLAGEQAAALEELALLQKNIEHIKDIVSMQQSYATVSGVVEKLDVIELVDDALRMNSSALARHDIQVIKDFDATAPILVEKHKLLQILVNLVRNAKHACDDSGRQQKRLTIRVSNGDDRVRIAVQDNGVGISRENLTRIFAHGFTTRKNGHGFGLHSGALVAKDMGGSLSAHSEGARTMAPHLLSNCHSCPQRLPMVDCNPQHNHEPAPTQAESSKFESNPPLGSCVGFLPLVLLWATPMHAQPLGSANSSLPLLTNVMLIRKLTLREANTGHPVPKIKGVMTYCDHDQLLFVQDSTGGIYISGRGKSVPPPLANLKWKQVTLSKSKALPRQAAILRSLWNLNLRHREKADAARQKGFLRSIDVRAGGRKQWIEIEGIVRSDVRASVPTTYDADSGRSWQPTYSDDFDPWKQPTALSGQQSPTPRCLRRQLQ